ncbi:MAG TPA: secretion system protein E [Fibrobacteres bacterium]|nr:secretion system protein E [Fibrobacterota bacterium]
MQRRRKKLGEILIAQGLITNEQLVEALQVHKRTGVSLGTVLVKLGYITEEELTGVLGAQIQLDQKKRIGEVLIDQGLINEDQLSLGLEEQKRTKLQLGKCLIKLGFISEDKLVDILSAQLDIQHVLLDNFNFNKTLVQLIPEDMARRYKVIPLFEKDGILTVAMADPTNLRTADHLKFKTGKEIEAVIATEKNISAAIERNYSTGMEQMNELLGSVQVEDLDIVKGEEDEEENEKLTDEEGAQIVKLVNLIITEAVNERASDIHIEPMERMVRLRYRIDGELVERNPIPLQLRAQITSRMKIMAGMDIAERRRPQDGHIQIRHQGREIDLRVSTFPVMTRARGVNEKMVLRIIDKNAVQLSLDQLGFLPGMLAQFDEIIKTSDGIVLVTGPTGSGKSSTLYAVLQRINNFYSGSMNIVTMEDPVEYTLDGITQGQINVKAGFTFADGMRSILRQDPDIIMIGEMRDKETCEMAIQAALTGHLVFSTLHTNDSASAFTRLLDMGLEPFLISSTIRGILAQRLVRRVCSKCKEPYIPDQETLTHIGLKPGISLYKAKGCHICNNAGYKGRSGIFELLVPDQQIKKIVLDRGSSDEIKAYLQKRGGFDTLRRDGLRKVVEGMTTLEQVLGVTQND